MYTIHLKKCLLHSEILIASTLRMRFFFFTQKPVRIKIHIIYIKKTERRDGHITTSLLQRNYNKHSHGGTPSQQQQQQQTPLHFTSSRLEVAALCRSFAPMQSPGVNCTCEKRQTPRHVKTTKMPQLFFSGIKKRKRLTEKGQ